MNITKEVIGENIAQNIVAIQKIKNVTQEDFAKFLGVKLPTYKTYIREKNKRNFPPPDLTLKLSNFIGLSINELYETKISEKYTKEQLKDSILANKQI
jgi:transcriptional regulator with XRE-family HTH domain